MSRSDEEQGEKEKGESEDTCTAHVAVTLFWWECPPSYFVLSLSLSLSQPFLYVCRFACHCFGAARRVREVIYRHFDCET